MFLDDIPHREAEVAWGEVGLRGDLGYERRRVSVAGQGFERAISAHAPSRITYDLGRRFRRFRARVAINDDSARAATHANFFVIADGMEVATVPFVTPGEPSPAIEADITGASTLELVATTTKWPFCHSVWLDPEVDDEPAMRPQRFLEDCMARVAFDRPERFPPVRDCVATVVSPGWEPLLARMLESVRVHGRCDDALKLIFAIDVNERIRAIASEHGAQVVPCQRRAVVNATVKSVLYSSGLATAAERYVCLDADVLVLHSLRPLFDAVSVFPVGSVLAAREANGVKTMNVREAVSAIYAGRETDLRWIMGSVNGEPDYPLVVNDGVFAASRDALFALDGTIRRWPGARDWTDQYRDNWWRNQFVFNLALAHLRCGVETDGACNVQLHSQEVRRREGDGRALWRGRAPKIMHFNGWGREKYRDWRERLLDPPS
jgi:hypothetical protein